MAGLLDFLQAASNSAASNVSGPVDGLAWLLRKAGIDVGEPVGGSAWMERQGLTRPVKQSGASLAGETAGLLAPIAAAAKAPQIAKGLLQMGENAATPRTLRPDQGAIVWHGSPHKFDRFDSSKIGTGEGAQAYGHGLYLAESPEVAGQYAKQLTAPAVDGPQNHAAMIVNAFKGDMEKALAFAKDAAATRPNESAHWADVIERLGRAPQIYKVDLPDSAISRMLDWDKPLSQQAPAVRAAIQRTRSMLPPNAMDDLGGDLSLLYGRDVVADSFLGTMNSLQPNLGESLLRKAGVPGVRYLDGGSRGAGTGTSNFVVFPGEESLLTILERNGIPLR